MSSSLYSSLPESPGIYLYRNSLREIIYIGKAINLKRRVASYFLNKNLGPKTSLLVSEIKSVDFILVQSEIEALLLEANLIKKYQPHYNLALKDGKNFPYIKITKDNLPQISISRKTDNQNLFFGPFLETKTLSYLLKILRHIFPYRSCKTLPKKTCLYFHLGMCPGPCINQSPDFKKEYRHTIKQISLFLGAKKNLTFKDLEKEMKNYSVTEDYEKAQLIKDRINKLQEVLSPKKLPFEYIKNPNLLSDIRNNEIKTLIRVISEPTLVKTDKFRIECYDISNLQGKEATGSMVVFINGEAEKSQYRRFKIRRENNPDDPAMIKEIVSRRFNHPEWPYPNLIIVDGGITQLKAALSVLEKNNLKIPVIGLAKKLETIYFKSGKTLNLPINSPALNLIKRIRDEAHRFAVSYHRKLRLKMLR